MTAYAFGCSRGRASTAIAATTGKPSMFWGRGYWPAPVRAAAKLMALIERDGTARSHHRPAGGETGESMRRATRRAEQRAARLTKQAAAAAHKAPAGRPIAAAGVDAAARAISRDGRAVTSPEAAWLALVLRDLRVRDDLLRGTGQLSAFDVSHGTYVHAAAMTMQDGTVQVSTGQEHRSASCPH
jgi:hypothetical protein